MYGLWYKKVTRKTIAQQRAQQGLESKQIQFQHMAHSCHCVKQTA